MDLIFRHKIEQRVLNHRPWFSISRNKVALEESGAGVMNIPFVNIYFVDIHQHLLCWHSSTFCWPTFVLLTKSIMFFYFSLLWTYIQVFFKWDSVNKFVDILSTFSLLNVERVAFEISIWRSPTSCWQTNYSTFCQHFVNRNVDILSTSNILLTFVNI